MAIVYSIFLAVYLSSLFFIVFWPTASFPVSSFISFSLAHLIAFFFIFKSNNDFIVNHFGKFKNLLLVAVVLRILFFWHPASDDLSRYAWEGKKVSQGVNPYTHAPLWFTQADIKGMSEEDKTLLTSIVETGIGQKLKYINQDELDRELTSNVNRLLAYKNFPSLLMMYFPSDLNEKTQVPIMERNDVIANNRLLLTKNLKSLLDIFQPSINHKHLPAIYPPISLLIFGLLMKLNYSVFAFKILFFLCDIINIVFIFLILKKLEKPLHWALVYAMSPLVLLYGVGECHLDILQSVFLISGIYFILFEKLKKWIALGFFLMGCAVLTKFLAIIALPFLINRKNYSYLIFFLLPFISYLFFIEPGMWSSLETFSAQMHFNDAIPRLLRVFTAEGSISYQLSMIGIFSIGYLYFFLFYQDVPIKGILYVWIWLLFCLPVLHPWYLISVQLFVCLYPKRNIFFLSMIMGFYFFVLAFQHNNKGAWVEFWWLPLITYIGFLIALLFEKWWFSPIKEESFESNKSLDIVIPVFNESNKIKESLDRLLLEIKNLQSVFLLEVNVLVVDGGSTDDTLKIIQDYPVKVFSSSEKGRGNQIALGIEKGKGDLVFILHADAVLKQNALIKMVEAFQQNNCLSWGVMGHTYDEQKFKIKIIEALNAFRFKYLGIAFGDQGMFFRREILTKIQIPKIPLMEDVEISLRLFKYPSRVNLDGYILASARRWQKRKFLNSVFQVIGICVKYLVCRRLGFDINALSKLMYKKYYG